MEIYKLHHHDSTQLAIAISNSAWRGYDAIKTKIFGTKLKIERGYVKVLIAPKKSIFSKSGLLFLNLPVQFPIQFVPTFLSLNLSIVKGSKNSRSLSPSEQITLHHHLAFPNVRSAKFWLVIRKWWNQSQTKVRYRVCIQCFMHMFARL